MWSFTFHFFSCGVRETAQLLGAVDGIMTSSLAAHTTASESLSFLLSACLDRLE